MAAARPSLDEIFGGGVYGPNGQPAVLGVNAQGDQDYMYDPNAQPKRPSLDEIFGAPAKKNNSYGANDTSIGRTALDQAEQGATFGFGDEAMDAYGALIAKGSDVFRRGERKLFKDRSVGDLYNEARDNSQQRLLEQMRERPALSIGANLAGALATGGAGATTKAGAALSDSLRTGQIFGRELGLAGRVAKGLAAGAASGGLYGAGSAKDGERIEGATNGAIYGGAIGGGLPIAGAVASGVKNTAQDAYRGLMARTPEALQDAAGAWKDKAGALFEQMRQSGATLAPQATQKLLNDVQAAVAGKQFIPELNPKTTAIVSHIQAAASKGDLSLSDLDQYRRLLGRIGATEDGVSAGAARKAIDSALNGFTQQDFSNGGAQAVKLLNQARPQYAQASKFEDVVDILTKAAGDPNKIKAGLTRFLNNSDNLRGWSPSEVSALRDAASSTTPEKLLKMGGKFGIDLGTSLTPGNTVAPLFGGYVGGPMAPVAGTAARFGQKVVARGKAETLLKTLEGAAPTAGRNLPPIAGISPAMLEGQAAGAMSRESPQTATMMSPMPMAAQKQASNVAPAGGGYFNKLADAESGNNPTITANTSSAYGKYQLTQGTVDGLIKKYGDETGINRMNWKQPRNQETLVKLLTNENLNSLQNTLGRIPSKGELYLAHFLGAPDAARLIAAQGSNMPAAQMFPEAAKANRAIFYDKLRPRSVEEIYQLLQSKIA